MELRQNTIEKQVQCTYDALIIVGGIDGAVAGARLSGKGSKVTLIEQPDFACLFRQEPSNQDCGGINCLDGKVFSLIWKLCKRKKHLIENNPSRVEEIRFLSTIEKIFDFHPRYIWFRTWVYWLFRRSLSLTRDCLNKQPSTQNISYLNFINSKDLKRACVIF
jgi:glycerol-3-phosphate dehydrogenase